MIYIIKPFEAWNSLFALFLTFLLNGRLHVSYSAYESPYVFMNDLYTKGLGVGLSFGHQLQLLVNTLQEKSLQY
jgi:hypothetical protein